MLSITEVPSLGVSPRSGSILSTPRIFRNDCSAALISLNTMPRNVARDGQLCMRDVR